jgi:preprotein translocase subunit SecF
MLNIVGKRYWYFALSLLVIVPGLIAMALHWSQPVQPFQLAIDFTGGSTLELKFNKPQPFQTDQVAAILVSSA